MVTFCMICGSVFVSSFDSLRKTIMRQKFSMLLFLFLKQNSMMILTPLLNCKKEKKDKVLFSHTKRLFANFVWAMQNFFHLHGFFLK
jgi:hypothetical protein